MKETLIIVLGTLLVVTALVGLKQRSEINGIGTSALKNVQPVPTGASKNVLIKNIPTGVNNIVVGTKEYNSCYEIPSEFDNIAVGAKVKVMRSYVFQWGATYPLPKD